MNTDIAQLLSQQENELSTLEGIIQDEFKILKSRDRSLLEKNALIKEKKLIKISKLDKAIKAEKSLTDDDQIEQFNEQQLRIKTLLGSCKSQNEVNGQIINSSQIAINRFKNILQKTLTNQSSTYDNKGLTNLSISSIGVKA